MCRRLQLALAAWFCACLFCLRLTAAEKEALPGVDDGWHYYKSPHFELYSRNGDEDSRHVLNRLELLRAVATERIHFAERVKLDVTLYYFRRDDDFRAYTPDTMSKDRPIAGFYQASPDRAIISLAPVDDWDNAQRLVFHEYVHHLFRAADVEPTLWYNEGMAEVLGGIGVEGDTVEIGRPQPDRLIALQHEKLMPLETLFAVGEGSPLYNSNDHVGLFYAESWAFAHYLLCGDSGIAPETVKKFLTIAGYRRGWEAVSQAKFFQDCFGMDYAHMLKQLDRYVHSGRYHFSRQPRPKLDPDSSYTVRAVPRDEVRLRLAELSLRVNRASAGRLALLDAAEKKPVDPRLLEVLGSDDLLQNDKETAHRHWESALEAGSRNPAVIREVCKLEAGKWFDEFNFDLRMPADVTAALRARLRQAIDFEPDQSPAYEQLAWLEAYAEKPDNADINLIQDKFPQLTHQDRVLLALALVRVHVGQPDKAATILGLVDKVLPDGWSAQGAEVIRAHLENRSVRQLAVDQHGNPMRFDPGKARSLLKTPFIDISDLP